MNSAYWSLGRFSCLSMLKIKKKNTTTLTIDIQLGLVGYNKHFLNLTVGAPGSTHGSRFLRKVFKF